MGFLMQNTAATAVGLGSGFVSYHLLNEPAIIITTTIAICGYLGGHLPHIQQPSQPSYRIIRSASWLATFLIPLTMFLYRPTDLLPAWLVAFLFTGGIWMIIDRISLRRDYTRSVVAIIGLPLTVAGCAGLALGQQVVIPAFLASSIGYILHLSLDQYTQRNWLESLKKPTEKVES